MQRNSRITTGNNDEQAISFVLHSDVVVLANKGKELGKKRKNERKFGPCTIFAKTQKITCFSLVILRKRKFRLFRRARKSTFFFSIGVIFLLKSPTTLVQYAICDTREFIESTRSIQTLPFEILKGK